MRLLVILAHPGKGSFNHAIADTVVKALQGLGHQITFHDLYDEKFDPVLLNSEIPKEALTDPSIEQHCDDLSGAEGIVVVHPNWWGQPPAILKGWVDRVIRPGVAYEFQDGDSGEGVPIGLLRSETAVVFNTSNTPKDREINVFGDPLETLWKNCIFDLCGVKHFYRRMFQMVVTSTSEQRLQWLEEVREAVITHFPC